MACRRISDGGTCVGNSGDDIEKEGPSAPGKLSPGELPLCLRTGLAEGWSSWGGAPSSPDPVELDSSTMPRNPAWTLRYSNSLRRHEDSRVEGVTDCVTYAPAVILICRLARDSALHPRGKPYASAPAWEHFPWQHARGSHSRRWYPPRLPPKNSTLLIALLPVHRMDSPDRSFRCRGFDNRP